MKRIWVNCIFALISISLIACGPAPQSPETGAPNASVAATTKPESPISILNWGPTETKAGTPFNMQPTGQSAMWIAIQGLVPSSSNYVMFGGARISEIIQEPFGVTFVVPLEAYELAGDKKVSIYEAETGRTIDVGTFKVLPAN